ncbi:hypothetical protein BpHYR1_012051 [Brachionus plicatilis]|uniref:Uncharacterized protein n=1 Tax=Brachionus plicatilis TaxID=10195 RepID=A0A3M7SVM9_BRAPC|nr:hypothetical protein BpHYR1_012051 [Brachionus plicatilis]
MPMERDYGIFLTSDSKMESPSIMGCKQSKHYFRTAQASVQVLKIIYSFCCSSSDYSLIITFSHFCNRNIRQN